MRRLQGLLTVVAMMTACGGGTPSSSTGAPDGSQPAATSGSGASTAPENGVLSDLTPALLTETELSG